MKVLTETADMEAVRNSRRYVDRRSAVVLLLPYAVLGHRFRRQRRHQLPDRCSLHQHASTRTQWFARFLRFSVFVVCVVTRYFCSYPRSDVFVLFFLCVGATALCSQHVLRIAFGTADRRACTQISLLLLIGACETVRV